MAPEIERKLAAILSADVVGYSRLMAEDDASTVRTLTAYREEIGELIRQHLGRVVDEPGDRPPISKPISLENRNILDIVQGKVVWLERELAGPV